MVGINTSMLARLLPQGGRFFELFEAQAEKVAAAARQLDRLIKDFPNAKRYAEAIDGIEHEADAITETSIRLLNSAFITPLDREQIHRLVTALDDVCDLIQDAGESLTLFDVRRITPEAERLAGIAVACCERVRELVALIHQPESSDALIKLCDEIDRQESSADRVMRDALSRLFHDEPDAREIIKMKTIYELLEEITDRCEDVADLAEGFVIQGA